MSSSRLFHCILSFGTIHSRLHFCLVHAFKDFTSGSITWAYKGCYRYDYATKDTLTDTEHTGTVTKLSCSSACAAGNNNAFGVFKNVDGNLECRCGTELRLVNINSASLQTNTARAHYDDTSCDKVANTVYGYISVYMDVSMLMTYSANM